jgi:predicted MPP superfamily phosphohydrolase
MRILFVADLHYALRQFDWLTAKAGDYDLVIIGGDLLDLGSPLDFDVQIVVVEKYLHRIRQNTRLLVSSGNHDGDSRNAANESFAGWLRQSRAEGLFVDGDSVVIGDTRGDGMPMVGRPCVARSNWRTCSRRGRAKYESLALESSCATGSCGR